MEEPVEEEYWSEDYENYSKFYEGEGKLKWIWRKGLCLGKKMVITGVVVSSVPFVLPPLMALSAIGVAFWVPAGFAFATYACTDKLVSTLAPMPSPLLQDYELMSSDEEEYGVDEDDVEKGYEEDDETEDEKEFEEDTRKEMEMRIELTEEDERVTSDFLSRLPVQKDTSDTRVRDADNVEGSGYEGDIGEYVQEEGQSLDSSAIPILLDAVRDAENEISLMESEGVEMPRDALREFVLEGHAGGENESHDVDQVAEGVAIAPLGDMEEIIEQKGGYEEDVGRYMEDEEQLLDSSAIPSIVEGIQEAENEMSLAEKEGEEMPRDALRASVVEAEVGENNESNVEQVVEGVAFVPLSNDVNEDSLHTRDSSGIQQNETGSSEGIEKPTDILIEGEGVRMPRDALRTLEAETEVGGRSDSNIDQVAEDMALVTPSEMKEDNLHEGERADVEQGKLRKDKWRPEGIEKPKESLRSLFTGEAEASGVHEKNVNQVAEELTFDLPRDVEEQIVTRGNLAGIDEDELRRETTGLLEQIRDEGRDDLRKQDIQSKEKGEGSRQDEGVSNKDMSHESVNKNLFIIPEELKPAGTSEAKALDERVRMRSEKGDKRKNKRQQQRPAIEKKLVVNVRPSGGHTAVEVHQEQDAEDKVGTLVLPNIDAGEMADEGSIYDRTETSDQIADSLDRNEEGEEQSENDAVPRNIVYHEVQIESIAIFKHAETVQDQVIAADSNKALVDEAKLWEQLHAMRIIVGFKDTPQSSCIEELKALYVFTGVEPPVSSKDPTDLVDVNEKLHFLMSIVGVK